MSLNIETILDEEFEIDPVDILGTIRFSNHAGSFLEQATFLDSWLYALITSLPAIESDQTTEIDLIDEPYPLEILRVDEGLIIRYKSAEVTTADVKELREALVQASQQLISQFPDPDGYGQNEMLRTIYDFVKSA